MTDAYDTLIITHLPVFYKINLFNEINKRKPIFVIFVSTGTASYRSDDFLALDDALFPYKVLNDCEIEKRNCFKSSLLLIQMLLKIKYKNLIVSGWDLNEFWIANLLNKKNNSALILESTINESTVNGFKYNLKRFFLSNISRVYSAGTLHEQLLATLHYNGETIITQGVGIIRRPEKRIIRPSKVQRRLIYIGRISPEKNISAILSAAQNIPSIIFEIYGDGPDRELIQKKAPHNVKFFGQIENQALQEAFSRVDALILPSSSEPWGLVVEEAIYFGLGVIVSEKCGVTEILDSNSIFSLNEDLTTVIKKRYENGVTIFDNPLKNNVDLSSKDQTQIECYLG